MVSLDGIVEHWNLILDKNELMEKTIALEIEKKSNQSKSAFLSRMSHDMRTPLNGIIGLLDICMEHLDDRELVDSSRLKAKVAANHLLSLVNDTLELNKLENADSPLYQEIFHLPTLLHEVETIARMRTDVEGIRLVCDSDEASMKALYLKGSPVYIKQILLNLLSNSIKYNRENGSIYWSISERDKSETEVELEFTIRDTGIGMSPEFLKDIFKPFVQADNGARSTYMGTGLGMAIVKKLLERMNGNIHIDSTVGVGTTVNVTLPLEIGEKKQDNPVEEIVPEVRKGLQILLAEDNELNWEIATFILEDEGMEVEEAVDGKQAVSLLLKWPEHYLDAILMDIMMPEMDGYEATHAIRESGRKDSGSIPIIAMTANAFDEDRKKSIEAGMNAHMAKPLDAKKLIKTIKEFCSQDEI